jgi:hypothetical protein
MSSVPDQASSPQLNRNDMTKGSLQQVRNSAHRGTILGMNAPGSNDSAAKNRHSYLQNVQFEMQKVSHKKGNKKGSNY